MLRNASEQVHVVAIVKEVSSEIRIVANQHSRVQLAVEEVVSSILEQGFCEVLKSYPLIDVMQFFCLRSMSSTAVS